MPEIVFHYPPELFDLLVDTIPRLNRSKKGVLLFFKGAGVSGSMLADLREIVATTPDNIDKFTMTRTVLERLNAKGEAALGERREVLRRVVDFTNYDSCWPDDRLKAKGLVAAIRTVVGKKGLFYANETGARSGASSAFFHVAESCSPERGAVAENRRCKENDLCFVRSRIDKTNTR